MIRDTDHYTTNGGQHGTARPSGNGGTAGVTRRVTMADAARALGISKEAVRKRVQRGTLRSAVGEDGRRYVYLDAGPDAGADAGRDDDLRNNVTEVDHRDELIATLKEQLEAERNAHAETRRIAYALAQRVPELEAAAGQGSERRDAPQTTAAEPEGAAPRPATGGAQAPAEHRSWWRRWFGFE